MSKEVSTPTLNKYSPEVIGSAVIQILHLARVPREFGFQIINGGIAQLRDNVIPDDIRLKNVLPQIIQPFYNGGATPAQVVAGFEWARNTSDEHFAFEDAAKEASSLTGVPKNVTLQ